MDLIGHDTNFAVTRSVFEANFFDKRYAPSLVQREMVDGGLFGRKSGQGFYAYPAQMPPRPAPEFETPSVAGEVTVYGDCIIADALVQAANTALARQGACAARERRSNWSGVQIDGARLVLTDGRPAFELAASTGIADIAVFDRPMVLSAQPGQNLAYALNSGASLAWQAQAPRWLRALGFAPLLLADAPGLVVARTVAMLINEAADAVLQGVCTAEGANEAMKLGLAFPAGPFEWLRDWSVEDVVAVVSALDAAYRGERYRVSPWLRRQEGRN